jgi:hypothetical protein
LPRQLLLVLTALEKLGCAGSSILSVQSYKNEGSQASGRVIKNQLGHAIVTYSRERYDAVAVCRFFSGKALYRERARNPQRAVHSNAVAGFSSSFFPRLFNPLA